MSSWCALNVAYEGDPEPDDVNTFLSQVSAYTNPNDGFDLILTVFTHGEDHGEVIAHLQELANEAGEMECVVSVAGNDTADIFTFKQHEDGGVVKSWSGDIDGYDPMSFDEQKTPLAVRVEEEIGRKPDAGGNYSSIHG